MSTSSHAVRVATLRVFFTLITACVIAAIVVQDHTHYFPLGVFNTGAATLHRIADGCLIAACAALVVQVTELARGRLSRVAGFVRGVYVSVAILDALLVLADRVLVTGNPNGLLGQYYEVPNSGRPAVMLKKPYGNYQLDPCLQHAAEVPPASPVLFLGDSYTEGSGRAPACNYPDVAQRVLREKWRGDAYVVHAGVSGYGPAEALSLLRWYRTHGCPVRAVVYNLTLQNDLADDLPRTERRVAAGIVFRFPSNWFLRTFHPLNTRSFRWALVLVFFGRASTHNMLQAVSVAGGPCDLTLHPPAEVSPFLRSTVVRDYENARRVVASRDGFTPAANAIDAMSTIAGEMKVPFFLVVFPDRLLADTELQRMMDMPSPGVSAAIHDFAIGLNIDHVIDVYPALAGRSGMYRTVDTHLSDAGNVVAGEFVGDALAQALRGDADQSR